MRRGRMFIYVALIIVVVVAAGAIWLWRRNATTGIPGSQSTPDARYVEIITAGQNIYPGTPITVDMLTTMQIPEEKLVEGEYTNMADVVSMYAKLSITQGTPIVSSMISSTPGTVSLPGSTWSPFIPQGLTAVSIPINRLTSVAYGIRDGDYVNVIVTFQVVDVDAAYQSILPNKTGGVITSQSRSLLIGSGTGADMTTSLVTGEDILNLMAQVAGSGSGPVGRVEVSEDLEEPFYVLPSESQRPRLVSQMVMQNVQVLHVGMFPLPGEVVGDLLVAPPLGTETTPTPTNPDEQVTPTIARPDIITLMVPTQDAVTLTWLVYSGTQITLTLRILMISWLVNNQMRQPWNTY